VEEGTISLRGEIATPTILNEYAESVNSIVLEAGVIAVQCGYVVGAKVEFFSGVLWLWLQVEFLDLTLFEECESLPLNCSFFQKDRKCGK
jgi:hypothetical protein